MPSCPSCANQVGPAARFCERCGTELPPVPSTGADQVARATPRRTGRSAGERPHQDPTAGSRPVADDRSGGAADGPGRSGAWLDAPAAGARTEPVAPTTDRHRLVTVVSCDVVDSTRLADRLSPAVIQEFMNEMSDIAERVFPAHGGVAGNRAGDGLLALFGVPMHGDDALRAVQAAVQFREELGTASDRLDARHGERLDVRIGIHSGELLVSEPLPALSGISADVLNVTDRLQKAAEPNEILLGDSTFRQVRDAVDADRIGPLTLKGKAEPVTLYRFIRRREDPSPPPVAVPMVGRTQEQALLMSTFERVVAYGMTHLVTISGPPGVGKSRLVKEFVDTVRGRGQLLIGRCLSYGDSATYWPMMQIVRQAADIAAADPPGPAHARLASLVAGEDHADRVTLRLAQLLGLSAGEGPPGDTSWALCRLLEAQARRRPLIVVIDDLHWAEPTLLEIIESVAGLRDVPLMLVCLARPELLERRPDWPRGTRALNSFSVLLSPLNETEGKEFITHLLRGKELDAKAQAHIIRMADGYPLFVEELLVVLREQGVLQERDGRWVAASDLTAVQMPPSVQAVVAIRLEGLSPQERALLERAAVVGEQFHEADLVELSSDEPAPEKLKPDELRRHTQELRARIARNLRVLTAKELVRIDPSPAMMSPLETEPGLSYRFRHILIRDAIYQAIDEGTRAELHERYASWLERTAGNRLAVYEEFVGYHLERAYLYRRETKGEDRITRELAGRAGERLAAGGQRAALRGDLPETLALLKRALRLLPEDHPMRLDAQLDYAEALRERELEQAATTFEQVVKAARKLGNQREEMRASLGRIEVMWFNEPERFLHEGREEIERSIQVLDELGDDYGLANAHRLLAHVYFAIGRTTRAQSETDQAIAIARRSSHEHLEAKILRLACVIRYWGQEPLAEVVRYNEQTLEWARSRGMRGLEAVALSILARTAAIQGHFGSARQLNEAAKAITVELGELLTVAAGSSSDGLIELLAGNLGVAEEVLLRGYKDLERMSGFGPLANSAAMLARIALIQGDDDRADEMSRTLEHLAAKSLLDAQIKWRSVRSVVFARRGELEAAEALAEEAVELARRSEQFDSRAEAFFDQAQVAHTAGRADAAEIAERALRLYERKGNTVAAGNVSQFIAALDR
jgi:predicted ATPase/class 3 adenylate cyclase